MEKMILTIEVVTPAFLSGANQKTVEIRAASVRGELRWWWRALHTDLNLNELRRREAGLFGSTETATKSPVRVRVETEGSLKVIPRGAPAPRSGMTYEYRRGERTRSTDILPYLGYGPIRPLTRREEDKARADNDRAFLDSRGQPRRGALFIRSAIAPGTRFRLSVAWRETAIDPDQQRELLEAMSAWLALGGVGSRSRKGFGSLRLIGVTGAPLDDRPLGDALSENVKGFRAEGDPLADTVPHWPSARHRIIHITAPCSSWQEALGRVGLVYKNNRPKDTRRWIGGDAERRRASAILLSVTREGETYRGVMALLPSTKKGTDEGEDAMLRFAKGFRDWRL